MYHFSLLCGYYIIRPLRDEMGIAGGVEKLQWMFSGTFVVMLAAVPLFGWAARRFAPRRLLVYVYLFFIGNLLLFFALFRSGIAPAGIARAFFIWASVYNLFIVSVFWSFMADIFTSARAARLFGIIAAGGTAGALAGPALAAALVMPFGPPVLLLFSAGFLAVAVLCIRRLASWKDQEKAMPDARHAGTRESASAPENERAIGGGVLAGIRLVFSSPYLAGICAFMLLFTTLSTFLYFQQAHIVRAYLDDPSRRMAFFAGMDFAVNALTLAVQVFLTGRIVGRFGIGISLAAVPALLTAGFAFLGAMPALGTIVAVQVVRRAGDYALTRPGREMLYVVLGREEKYKAKNFIDTVVYRGGDALSAWAYAAMGGLGLSVAGTAFAAMPLAALWAWIAWRLGLRQETLAAAEKGTHGGR
ncbi:MAG: MFS transporter [Spirochaetes bacterium]|nr:MAG: MFS transporter [Spirochaetota bacterium]